MTVAFVRGSRQMDLCLMVGWPPISDRLARMVHRMYEIEHWDRSQVAPGYRILLETLAQGDRRVFEHLLWVGLGLVFVTLRLALNDPSYGDLPACRVGHNGHCVKSDRWHQILARYIRSIKQAYGRCVVHLIAF